VVIIGLAGAVLGIGPQSGVVRSVPAVLDVIPVSLCGRGPGAGMNASVSALVSARPGLVIVGVVARQRSDRLIASG
jgi:hypothetical protein